MARHDVTPRQWDETLAGMGGAFAGEFLLAPLPL